jgi:hypothetical protein
MSYIIESEDLAAAQTLVFLGLYDWGNGNGSQAWLHNGIISLPQTKHINVSESLIHFRHGYTYGPRNLFPNERLYIHKAIICR